MSLTKRIPDGASCWRDWECACSNSSGAFLWCSAIPVAPWTPNPGIPACPGSEPSSGGGNENHGAAAPEVGPWSVPPGVWLLEGREEFVERAMEGANILSAMGSHRSLGSQ